VSWRAPQELWEYFDREVAAKGETAVLYDIARTIQAYGTGL
jgi:hypothetical protein